MIAQLIHIGPASNCQDMKGDANEALLIIGATLFWAAVSPSHLSFSPSPRCGSEGSPRGGGDWSDEPKGGVVILSRATCYVILYHGANILRRLSVTEPLL